MLELKVTIQIHGDGDDFVQFNLPSTILMSKSVRLDKYGPRLYAYTTLMT